MQLQQEVVETETNLEDLRRRLQSRATSSRQEAELELSRLRASDLIQLMEVEKSHRLRRRKTLIGVVIAYIALTLIISILGHNSHMFNVVACFGGVIGSAMAFTGAHKSAARALAKYEDIESVSPLIEALEIPDSELHFAVSESLTRMLPKMRSSDGALLTADAKRILRRQMAANPRFDNRSKADQFVEAALKALEQVGDESFVATVEGLAAGRGYGNSVIVQKAAEECLPALRQRAEYDRMSHNLLRASTPATSHDADQLLRAAEAAGTTDSTALLRASTSAAKEEFRA